MTEKDFVIMSKDTAVAVWKNGCLTVLNDTLLPLCFKKNTNAESWLATRAIDSHRANSRLLKKALRLREKDDVSTTLYVNGAKITDTYWVKPVDSKLCYGDVRFDSDFFSNLALNGSYESFNRAANSKHSKTPELTNTGSFEKCWKLRDGEWWMYKKANHNEQFSELFIYELGKALGMNMAVYERGEGCVKSKDFTNAASINFEPASTFMGDNEEYPDVIKALKKLCPDAIPDYIRMIFLDTVTQNPDRHTNNFGLLRDVESGKLISLAPNFDNNMALIARGYPKNINASNDLLIKLFVEVIEEYPEYTKYIPEINEQNVRKVLSKLNMKVRTQVIVDIVVGRYNRITEKLNK
ncbi:MAG: HipA domain-containing protein [Clostridia bacterium]|nr:HipA domain-containing protein [Clostridia bacterium]